MKLLSNPSSISDMSGSDHGPDSDDDVDSHRLEAADRELVTSSCLHDDDDMPTALIVTNVDVIIFDDDSERLKFEELFREFDDDVTVQYFKSFRRVKVNFGSSANAACARIQLHQTQVCNRYINCYFAQVATKKDNEHDVHLHPPIPDKQFLISPPASPPEGWEPVVEAEPVINYDLLAAIAKLTPGEAHELHPPTETQPAIVVHICEEAEKTTAALILPTVCCPDVDGESQRPKIVQTRCPSRNG